MATNSLKRCTRPGCRTLTRNYGGRCDQHKKRERTSSEAKRPNAAARGYGYRWQQASARYKQEHPLCVACMKIGRVSAAECVDHVVPHRGDDELFWNQDNWASMCTRCHNAKTARGE